MARELLSVRAMRIIPLLLGLLVACGPQRVSSIDSDISVGAEALDFGTWVVGGTKRRSLPIDNRSRIPETLSLKVAAPFAAPEFVDLEGGAHVEVPIDFTPSAVGPVEVEARVGSHKVVLRGAGVAAQVCASVGCEVQTLDPVTGRCTTSLQPDGASCTSADECVTNGTCRAGVCVGEARDCDDHNACTTDACARGSGCVHVDTSDSCPAVSEPCHVAVCDPVRGCGSATVADGTPCGSVSCAEANVCLQGVCKAVTPPDGFTCSPSSPCQGEGRCQAKVCVAPAKAELSAAWEYVPVPQVWLQFEGVVDAQGSFYWLECRPPFSGTQCEAVSYTANGLQRFRTPLPTTRLIPGPQLFDGGRFIAALDGSVFSVDGATGALLWTWRHTGVGTILDVATAPGGGVLWVRSALGSTGPFPTTVFELRQLDAANAQSLSVTTARRWDGLVVDARGNAWSTRTEGPATLVSLDRAGQEVATAALGGVHTPHPESVDARELVLDVDDVVDLASLRQTHVGPSGEDFRLLESLQLASGRFRVREDRLPTRSVQLLRGDGSLVTRFGENHAGPYATSDGVLYATGNWAGFRVDLLSRAGTPSFSCPAHSEWALTGKSGFNGRQLALLVECAVCEDGLQRLHVFDVGALGVAGAGWVAPRGTPGRAGHAR